MSKKVNKVDEPPGLLAYWLLLALIAVVAFTSLDPDGSHAKSVLERMVAFLAEIS